MISKKGQTPVETSPEEDSNKQKRKPFVPQHEQARAEKQAGSHIIMCFPESTQLSVVSRPPG
jgi:hypothetical protein